MVAYNGSAPFVFLVFLLSGLLLLWFAYKALKASSSLPRYALGFALAGGALLFLVAVAQTVSANSYYGRMDIADSFWLQVLVYLLAGPLIIWRFGKFLRLFMAPLFAYGLGFAAAGGILFLASLLILEQTSSGGRGWGGLIFLFLFFADAALAGIGGLLLVIGLVKWLLRVSAVNAPMEAAPDAQYARDGRQENHWKTEYPASEPHSGATGAKECPECQGREEPPAAMAAQKNRENGA